MGALPESQILAFIERVTKGKAGGNETLELMKSADAAIAEGDTQGAAEIYSHILEEDPANVPALAGLARCHVANNELEKAKQVLTQVPAAKQNDAAVAAARAALEVAEQASSVGPIGELEQKVAANPLDHQARFDLAVALNAAGKRQEAVDRLMEIIRRDRKWNEDGARKQLVQFFEAWGPTDEATVAGRKKLSSVLFA
jgi:putative thioredoxin